MAIIPVLRKQGTPLTTAFQAEPVIRAKNRTRYAPHQSTTLTASPRGEALKRLTIFSRQGEALKNKG